MHTLNRSRLVLSRFVPPATVFAGCEILVQFHGWTFWRAHFHPTAGPALSVVLGILAAIWWAWACSDRKLSQRLASILLGIITTTVLLAGPLYQVADPVIQARLASEAALAVSARLDAAISARRAELDRYLDITAQGRFGWHGRIDETRAALAELEVRRNEIAAPGILSWQTWAACGLQGLALVLLQLGAVTMAGIMGRRLSASRDCSRDRSNDWAVAQPVEQHVSVPEDGFETQPEQDETPSESVETPETLASDETKPDSETSFQPDDLIIKRLQREIRARIDGAGLSASRWCRANGCNPRDISFLMNHFRRVQKGQPTISAPKLRELAETFLKREAAQA